MSRTIPPSGLAPTVPPPPGSRARRAVQFASIGLALLAAALIWRHQSQPDAATFFAYDNDAELGSFVRRVMFGVSGGLHIAAVAIAARSLKLARAPSLVALVLSGIWFAAVVLTLVS